MANGREKLSNDDIKDLLKEAGNDIFHPNVDKVFNHMKGATWTSGYEKQLETNYSGSKMTEAGRENGRQKSPSPSKDAKFPPAGVEHDFIEFGEKWRNEMKGTFESIAGNIYDLMGNAKITIKSLCRLAEGENPENFYDTDRSVEDAQNTLKNKDKETTSAKLKTALDNFRDNISIFRNFREDHQLDRKPSYPSSNEVTFIWCGVLIAVESFINAFFYRLASDSGFLGGLPIACAFSLAIVLPSVVGGRLFTYKNAADKINRHNVSSKSDEGSDDKPIVVEQKSRNKKMVWCSRGLFFVAILVVFIAAIYRDGAELLNTTDGKVLMGELWERFSSLDILPKAGIEGIGLIALNFVILIFAVYKGYHWEDVIPEYKVKAETFATDRETYKNAITEATGNIGKAKDFIPSADALNIKRYDTESMESLAEKYELGCGHLQTLKTSADEYLNNIDINIKERLDIYRIANKQERDENINHAPEYFKVYPEFGKIAIKVQELDQKLIKDFRENIEKIIDILDSQRQAVIKDILEKYDKLYKQIVENHGVLSEKYKWEENSQDPRE